MDEATYRILDILSRRLGIPMSINEITKSIGEIHGGAYYANTHKTGQMEGPIIIRIKRSRNLTGKKF